MVKSGGLENIQTMRIEFESGAMTIGLAHEQ